MANFTEVRPGKQHLKRAYLHIMLWFTGRAVQAAARVDPEIKSEFDAMPPGYCFSLGAFPSGPAMVVGKTPKGKVKYLGRRAKQGEPDLTLNLKSLEHLFQLFTFQESTPAANARDRLFVDGDIPHTCAVVRILDKVQVYLLPRFIARLAVKQYPKWTLKRHTLTRTRVYLRTLLGL
ncbi:MAG: hypothetical protein MI747_05340 [Desulfobacterales bacterium]|nr:hypothetical protein [Desulfobacterales bacterium]